MARPIKGSNKDVTTAGTAVALSATSLLVSSVTIEAKATNTGVIYVGSSTVSSADNDGLAATESINWESDENTGTIDLAAQYIDSSVNGEGVNIWYVEAQ